MKKPKSAINVGTTLFSTEVKANAKLAIKILITMKKLNNASHALLKNTLIVKNFDVQFVLQKLHTMPKKINVLVQLISQSLMKSSKLVSHALLMKIGMTISRSV